MEDKTERSVKKEDYDSTMNAIPEKELLKEEMLKKSTSPPFPQALHGKKGIRNAAEILETGKSYHFSHDWRKGSGESLLDLGASVNLLPYSVYKQLGLGELKPTAITLSLADRSVKFQGDPTVKEANLVPIILGRPFLATSNAIINSNTPEEEEGPEEVCLNPIACYSTKLEKIEEILPLFNKEEGAAAEKEIQNSI
ncbi:hypothetical protein CK203_045676 [Vitis vinifera]|uniref:Uncharacterized protein n=1 Tax=Vitis vinifera TaxID=29760 RepID=A0A438HQ57_VITVI|nr:hypothetical protein CK203_045676 [Vitis vinifera]